MSTKAHRSTTHPQYNVTFSPTPITRDHNNNNNNNTNAYASSSSSPAPLIPASSSPTRSDVAPLRAAKTIPLITRRAVIFSPRNDTKYFHSDDSILPSPTRTAPPPSIRAYPQSDPITPFETPSASRGRHNQLSDTPTLVRSILKARAEQIRLAASVEEGTLNNKEAARLLVSGKRPRLIARDSFQLALMQKAAAAGVGETADRKGKGRMPEEIPGSDDSNASTDMMENQEPGHVGSDGSTEEEEELEQDGALATGSLVNIILDGAEELLTLEEAYNTLVARLRERIPSDPDVAASITPSEIDDIRIATQPIRDEAPAMVRALQRDLQRLLGKLPSSEMTSSAAISSPFRELMPLTDGTPTPEARSRFTPSPTPNLKSSPSRPARQGYTESEVRYRREAAGVGAAVLRFLAFTFNSSHLFSCFTDADLQSLLEQVLIIPRTPKLPTPNTKRTYYLSIFALAQMNLPAACIQPVKEKVVRALESAMNDSLGSMSPTSGKEGPTATKKEGCHAITHLVSNYPSIFFPYYSELLPSCLRGLTSPNNLVRYKSGAAVCAFARGRFTMMSDAQMQSTKQPDNASREAWTKAKQTVQKSEFFVVQHLKSALKLPGKNSPIYGKDGEKKTEWHSLDQTFKDAVGSTTDVHWACATWAAMVTLMGTAYGSSGFAAGFNHIMERSLAPSTNLYRPLLARVAWSHAIHAYLSAGFASSITTDGQLVRSYKPFAASAQMTIEERTKKIQMAFQIALPQAADPSFFARALATNKADGTQHYMWQRSEKAKKLQWLITSCLGATAVVYAYSGMAICHEDQPAKEMTAISGLPSSDGIPMPDLTPEESRLPRLDNAWEKVVHPILTSYLSIRGVDRLTIQAWSMLAAITSPKTDKQNKWSLDRLLSARYMSGEIYNTRDKDTDLGDLLEHVEADDVQACDIPAWGDFWVAKRLGRLLALFDEALSSINGINIHSGVDWVMNDRDVPLIPHTLSRVWSSLLQALRSVHLPGNPPTPLFFAGLQAVTRQLVHIFNRDPKSYMPISRIDETGQCTFDEDEVRVGLTSHLFKLAVDILGTEILGTLRLPTAGLEQIAQHAFGCDGNGSATVAGNLLGQLLRTKAISMPASPFAQSAMKELADSVLEIACTGGCAGKVLGDITNVMPWIFDDNEEMQLDIWRLIATKWTQVIDVQPTSATTTSTNHTGALLVSLLSGPFRGRLVTSYWHQRASLDDLAIWRELLKVTVLRFKAKRVGSNLGVLESLAGHLVDFLGEGDKTSSSTITLSCLASATLCISFVPSEHYHTSHYSINENYAPTDFLTLVNDALIESYPSFAAGNQDEDGDQTQLADDISPAVRELLESFRVVFGAIPAEFAGQVLQPVRGGLGMWMQDEQRVATDELAQELDALYVTLLLALTKSIGSTEMPLSSETMNDLVEIYAPRLARAESSAVPLAFQNFWQNTFAQKENLEYSDDVAGFLRDMLAAVPGMVAAPGLEGESQLSEEESLERFPHTQSLRSARMASQEAIPVLEDEKMEVDQEALPTDSYDADISLEPTQVQPPALDPAVESRPVVPASEASDSVAGDEDVFGPAAMTKTKSSKGRKKGKKAKAKGKGKAVKKSVEEAQSLPEASSIKAEAHTTLTASVSLPDIKPKPEPEALVDDSDDDAGSDCIIVQPSPTFYRRRGLKMPSPTSPLVERVSKSEPEVEHSEAEAETKAEVEEPLAAPSSEAEPVVPALAPVSDVMLGMSPEKPIPVDLDDEEEEDFSPTPTPTASPPPKAVVPLSQRRKQKQKVLPTSTPAPAPIPAPEPDVISEPTPGEEPRSSLLRGWLSRVPSLGAIPFFSPGPTSPRRVPDATVPSSQEPQKASVADRSGNRKPSGSRRGKRKAREIDEEEEMPDLAAHGMIRRASVDSLASLATSTTSASSTISPAHKRKRVPVVDVPIHLKSNKRRKSSKGKALRDSSRTPVPPSQEGAVEEEDEDELLLSPESARRGKREEEEGIIARIFGHGQSQSQSQSQSGRFDDAPNDPSPTKSPRKRSATPLLPFVPLVAQGEGSAAAGAGAGAGGAPGPSPLRRTVQQTRVLSMLEEAARAKEIISNLDYAGVKSLLRNLHELREAAEGRMMAKMEEYRGDR